LSQDCFTIVLDDEESELTRVDEALIRRERPDLQFARIPWDADPVRFLGSLLGGVALRNWLFTLALLVFLLETFLACRFIPWRKDRLEAGAVTTKEVEDH